ncbi:hypothetical protein SAMN05443549_103205 [Flavobacterium fluvii]|uniref:SGNH/GDSL hydrolase family protein n=1 Tax=Flavobacterium fluvii TaxID=468056 RepID=A0A1M5IRC3_9FLAO|nr:hypothetical protein [Flavobacterium fluvii]SHG30786.1 hypothetical protein SAMN05443549_103205 [Flavobacterium fluvii]
MKKFSSYIVGGLALILLMMSILDIGYTKIYEVSYPRTKFQYLRSLEDTKVDYIFLGSSRVENGIIPSVIIQKTNKTAVNLGFQASKAGDIFTVLQLIKKYNIHYEKILIQIDYIYNNVDGNSNIFQFEMIPFIRENEITKQYSNEYSRNPIANYYLPFFRYCSNDLRIGFREVFSNVIHKKTTIVANKGYVALQGNSKYLKGSLPNSIINNNAVFDSIRGFCKKNKIDVVYYCAPFCKNNKNKDFTSKLKIKIPELIDFSTAINDDQMFENCNHLNDRGARRFTEILAEELLVK